MEKENITIILVNYISGIGWRIKDKDMENIFIRMVKDMLASGIII